MTHVVAEMQANQISERILGIGLNVLLGGASVGYKLLGFFLSCPPNLSDPKQTYEHES